jgi:diguanylate cyclase (GGDEF)-like protein
MNSMVTWHYDLSTDTSQHDYTFSHTLATESVNSRKILIIDNAMEDPRFQSSQSIFASRILSVICIPLFRGKDVLGVIYLDNLKNEGQFHDVHENFLRTFAHQSSMALHNAKLYTQAVTDDLSGLFLRKYMERRIREELARVDRHQGTCSLLMIDIDFFKHVNDTYGHIAGDKVITEIARRLQSSAREMDVVGRFGGEEFLMLLPETRKEGALIMAERVRKKLTMATFQAEGRTFSITASIGIVCSSSVEKPNTEKFIQAADKALYTAKETGRNRCIVYSPSSTHET